MRKTVVEAYREYIEYCQLKGSTPMPRSRFIQRVADLPLISVEEHDGELVFEGRGIRER